MDRPQRLRQAAYVLRACGLALMTFSVGAGLLHGAVAQVMPVPGFGTPIPDATPTLPPTPPPVSARAATATKAETVSGGPVRLRLTGNLTLGEHGFSSSRGGYDVTTAQSSESAGFLMELERRTATTSLTFGVPMGVAAASRSTIGQIQVGYYTPHYGLQYAQQPLSALGGVPLGSSMAAIALVLPLQGGDLTLYQGGGYLDTLSRARLYGMRARKLVGRTLTELGFVQANRSDTLGSASTLIAGFANQSGKANTMVEAALQFDRSPGAAPRTVSAFQYLLNYGGASSYTTFSAKHVGAGFQSLGAGALTGDDQISASFRAGSLTVQEALDRAGGTNGTSVSRQSALSFYRDIGTQKHPVSMMLQLGDDRTISDGDKQWIGTAGLQFATSLRDLSALFGAQATRTTSFTAAPLSTMTYQSTFQKPLAGFLAGLQLQTTRSASEGSFTHIGSVQGTLTRQFGLTALSFSDTFTHTFAPAVDQRQWAPLLTVQRRISAALALGISYGIQSTRDALNPGANGSTRMFNVQVTAPFAIGSGVVQGHANPKLPATVSGTVTNSLSAQSSYAQAIAGGVSNVAVVLDGVQVQRTDLAGHYQFNFVQPGRHTVEIDLASLPRGVTPDEPVATINVLGGQEGVLNFEIGTSGAIIGRIMGRDADGTLVPISGVVLTVDTDGGVSTTATSGMFGFGKLTPGTHTVAIQESSLPATVAVSKDTLSRQVSVRAGQVTSLDFLASSLGSLAGAIVFDPSLAPEHSGGAFNSYVVAEPGDFAAIADQDGSFLMDNLPPGTYTIDVDPETLPPDTGNTLGPQTITVGPDQHIEGVRFTIGHKAKAVVFSFKTAEAPGAQADLQHTALPPGGTTEIALDAPAGSASVTASAFHQTFPVTYDAKRKRWIGTVVVPLNAAAGKESVKIAVKGSTHFETATDLNVDTKIPIATFTTTPRRPLVGQYATVRARILADVHAGDVIHWADGQVTRLGPPLTGRVFLMTVKISVHPLHGLLLTRQGQLPILLP